MEVRNMKKLFFFFMAVAFIAGNMNAQNVNLTVQVDMSVQQTLGNFDPASGVVYVAGSFNEWSVGATQLEDGDSDLIYTATLEVAPDTTYYYKFVMGADGWEGDPNREVVVADVDVTVDPDYFNRIAPLERKDIGVLYICDMTYEIGSGRFDPNTQIVEVRGAFFNWDATAPEMTANPLNPNEYEYEAVQYLGEGDALPGHKFVYANADGSNVTWEGDAPYGGNYTQTVTADDMAAEFMEVVRAFGALDPGTITQTPFTLKFRCNTTLDPISSANNQPFTVVNTVHMFGATAPLKWPGGGWPSDEIGLGTELTDADEDGIFEAEVGFSIYSPLRIQYKYGINYGDVDNNQGANDNENGVGQDHFVTFLNDITYSTVTDTFNVMTDKPADIYISAEDVELAPTEFSMSQNYPNPFNPSTTISFALPKASNVVLKVYNLLGQEVATLINGQMNSGSHNVRFDASNLTSGMYIYKIQAGSFTSTAKMMLVK